MSKVLVRVKYIEHWKDEEVITPHEFNFPSSRADTIDALYEWVNQHFSDKQHTSGFPRRPYLFYIKQIDGKSVFTI